MSESTKGKRKPNRKLKCRSCGGLSSTLEFDVHATCQRCRVCSQEKPCGSAPAGLPRIGDILRPGRIAWHASHLHVPNGKVSKFCRRSSKIQLLLLTKQCFHQLPRWMLMANCGTLEDFSSFSHVFDRSFPASAGQSHLHRVLAKEFRAFPSQDTANFRPSKWSFFPGDPRRLQ